MFLLGYHSEQSSLLLFPRKENQQRSLTSDKLESDFPSRQMTDSSVTYMREAILTIYCTYHAVLQIIYTLYAI